MYSFRDIVELTPDHVSSLDFLRSEEEQQKYDEFTKEVKSKYASVTDYILRNVFQCDVYSENGKIYAIKSSPQRGPYVWAKNSFPYNVAPDVEHFVLWCMHTPTHVELTKEIDENVPKGKISWHFVNAKEFQTVPEIFHAHVFILN
jgi:hypothetical protein